MWYKPSQNWLPNLKLAGNQNNRIQFKYRDCLQQITTVFITFVSVTFPLVLFVLPSFRLNRKSDFILMIFQSVKFYSIHSMYKLFVNLDYYESVYSFSALQYLSLKYTADYKICMGLQLLHVPPFCVEEDFLLMLLDSCIAGKDIWFLHVLPLCVEQDAPLMLLDSFTRIFDSFMYHPFVFSKSPL